MNGRRPPRPGSATVVAAVVVVALVAVVWWRSRPIDRADLVVVGDSVSYLAAGAIGDRLGDDHRISFLTRPGFTAGQDLLLLSEAMDDDGGVAAALDRVAVLTGYNDVRLDSVETASLRPLVEATSQFRCAVWLTLPERPGGEPSSDPDMDPTQIERWNERLAAEIERFDNVHLAVDWQEVVERSPATDLLDDGLHPTPLGRRRLAEAYEAALDRSC